MNGGISRQDIIYFCWANGTEKFISKENVVVSSGKISIMHHINNLLNSLICKFRLFVLPQTRCWQIIFCQMIVSKIFAIRNFFSGCWDTCHSRQTHAVLPTGHIISLSFRYVTVRRCWHFIPSPLFYETKGDQNLYFRSK